MEALAATSCSAVTEDHLAQVDSLTLTADKVDADDVAGLTAITSIDLTLTGAPNAQLASLTTLKDATISLTLPPTIPYGTRLTAEQRAQNKKNLAEYTIADDFLPFGEQLNDLRQPIPREPEASFHTLRFNITGGDLPSSSEIRSMSHHLLDQRYLADNVTINDDSSEAYGILNFTNQYKEGNPFLTGRSVKNLTLILNHPPGTDKSISTSKHWLYRDWVDSITIINENSNRALQIRSDFMTCEAGAKATYSADSVSYHTFKLEIRRTHRNRPSGLQILPRDRTAVPGPGAFRQAPPAEIRQGRHPAPRDRIHSPPKLGPGSRVRLHGPARHNRPPRFRP